MGNEQSGGSSSVVGGAREKALEDGASPSTSTGSGMPSSFSFLAKKRNSTKSGLMNSIVVVNDGVGSAPLSEDADLKRLKEIPRFFPLLRGVLPGYRDLPEVHQKLDDKLILRFLHRLQCHFRQCAQLVATEQGRMFARIVEIDQLVSSLLKKTATNSKKLDALNTELKRVGMAVDELESIQVFLQELTRSADSLNQLLSDEERLPPLQVAFTPILTRRKLTKNDGTLESNRPLTTTGAMNSSGRMEADPRKVSETKVVDRK